MHARTKTNNSYISRFFLSLFCNFLFATIVCSRSLGSGVGLNEAIQDQSVIDICFLRHYCNFA